MITFLLAFACAMMLATLGTPLIRWLAWRYQFVDKPDGGRKVQGRPVAFGGGIVLFFTTLISISAFSGMPNVASFADAERLGIQSLVFLAAVALIVLLGVWDDKYLVRGRTKLFFQFVAAVMVVASGPNIESVSIGGMTIHLGNLGAFFSLIWILGSINSFNLIDGVDGLASTIGLVIATAVGVIAVLQGDVVHALIAFSLAGAICGFLFYNWMPASIYLGDSGSMMIGMVLGVIALRSTVKEATSVAFAPLIAIWAILILDSAAAVVRRTMTGRSIYCTDRGHIHHRFIGKGFQHWQVTLCIGALCAFTSLGAVLSIYWRSEFAGLIFAASAIIALAVTRVFGHVEFSLLGKHLFHLGRNKWGRTQETSVSRNSLEIQLQGNHHWNELWTAFLESTDRYGLVRLRLNLHLPRYQEDFFANWTTQESYDDELTWIFERPLMCGGNCVGRLFVRGRHLGESHSSSAASADFMDCLDALEEQLGHVVRDFYDSKTRIRKAALTRAATIT